MGENQDRDQIFELTKQIDRLRKENASLRKAESAMSSAYVRLRNIIPGALDTPHAPTCGEVWARAETAARRLVDELAAARAPVDVLLFCPKCKAHHVDEPDERTEGWTNPPHRSHLCHRCGTIWRAADVPTNGVDRVNTRGSHDTWPAPGENRRLTAKRIIHDVLPNGPPGITPREIHERIGVGARVTVKHALRELLGEGLAKCEGEDCKRRYWRA